MAETEERDVAARVLHGIVAGTVAGIVASFAMDRFQAAAAALSSSDDSDAEPATEKAADAVARAATGSDVPDAEKPLAGQAVHYALGTALGIAYGIAAEFRPGVTTGFGSAFGLGTATLLDEAAVPAVGLGDAPWKAGATTHLYSYASHLVFGAAAELTRRQVAATLKS
jgi:putative membrane protein